MLRRTWIARRFRRVGPLLGVATAAVAVALRLALAPVIGVAAPYAFNAIAVLVASLMGGWLAGLTSTLFGLTATALLLFGPGLRDHDTLFGLVSAALAQSLFVAIVRIYQQRVDAEAAELRSVQTALVESSRRQQLLIDELNHRVKNTLMIVQSLAQQTFGAGASADARRAFEGRLAALARAHDTLTQVSWDRADLLEVVKDALDGCGVADRVAVRGPALTVEPRTAVMMAMAVHELCTNALKYGALSVPGGRATLDCARMGGESPRLQLCWREIGGPPVRAPARQGFGTRMLERALAGELDADVDLDFAPSGLVCTIEARRVALFQENGAEARSLSPAPAPARAE